MQNNLAIIQVLEVLRKKRELAGEGFRSKAYEKAIEVLKLSPPITSKKQASCLKGIGKGISERIQEILDTGTCKELGDEVPGDKERQRILSMFMALERVGPKTAETWYNRGYRSFADVPLDECTTAQKIGIALYPELSQRIPRAEIDIVRTMFETLLKPYGVRFEIAGSYRRNASDSGDIDILVQGDDSRILDIIGAFPMFTHILAKGVKKILGICKPVSIHRRIDIELTNTREWIPALIYFTGSASFNVKMRQYCAERGFRLNEKGLFDSKGNLYLAHSEEHFFSMLRLAYLTPEQRSDPEKYWKVL